MERVLIAALIDFDGRSGDSVRYKELSRTIAELGMSTTLFCVDTAGTKQKRRLENLSVVSVDARQMSIKRSNSITRLLDRLIVLLRIYFSFFRFCVINQKKSPFPFIISYGSVLSPIVFLASRITSGTWIYDVRGLSEGESKKLGKTGSILNLFTARLESFSCQNCSKVITVSTRIHTHLSRLRHIPKSKMVVSPDGADIELFRPDQDRGTLKRDFKIDVARKVVMFVGSFSPREGVDRILRAFPYVRMSMDNVKLVIIGGGTVLVDSTRSLKEMTQELGICDDVIFTGRISHKVIPHYLVDADVCIAPFVDGYSPIKVYEYLASGRPTIVTAGTDVGELLVESKSGLAIATWKPEELALAILELLHNKELADELGRNGANLVRERFTWKVIAGAVMRILRNHSKPKNEEIN